jgi:L-asparaginase / beta-aspartyl-peptidase
MYALAVHGGAAARAAGSERHAPEEDYRAGLAAALELGQSILERHGCALDAVEAAVALLEDNPLFNAGRGAVLTAAGTVELDASIMDGSTLRAGAVAQVRRVANPIRLARRVLERLRHVFLVGDGAEAYAVETGMALVSNEYFITPTRMQQLAVLQQSRTQAGQPARGEQRQPGREQQGNVSPAPQLPLGTVGAVARDHEGRLAAATSTGGTAGQRVGRVGDSPVIGAGTYADDLCCAVSTTGHGEAFLRTVLAHDIAARVCYRGDALAVAVERALEERLAVIGGRGGVIAVDRHGEIVTRHNSGRMYCGYLASNLEMHINV